eukprot:351690-Chlamydomonas_euryale.AAC.2
MSDETPPPPHTLPPPFNLATLPPHAPHPPRAQFSISTSGSSFRLLEQLLRDDPVMSRLRHTVIPSWYQRQGYVGAMVDLMEGELQKFADPDAIEIFFSAHGVPVSYVEEVGRGAEGVCVGGVWV